MTLIPCILCDMDDTLSDPAHRMHLRPTGDNINDVAAWRAFHDLIPDDAPDQQVIDCALYMAKTCLDKICIITGRPDDCFRMTSRWLRRHGIEPDELLMRPRKDFRPQLEIKRGLIQELKNQGYWPLMAAEDEHDVCQMYHDLGIKTYRVIDGKIKVLKKS